MNVGKLMLALPLAVAVLAAPALGDDMQGHNQANQAMHGSVAVDPTEPGQGAFAAIQEIVAILEADPSTDWTRVDLGALRRHLVNMNALIISAEVAERKIPGGIEATVSGAGRAGEAARRMVPAHAGELARVEGWAASAEELAGGNVVLRVTSTDRRAEAHIRGLGFFGLMASGGHHQPHHLAIARGGTMQH
ncbi:MAG: hypothetical protein IMF05_15555 [Proteobacteria bacterium]|nr:hypothetical protein [Pseudomonadota bacterium]